MKQTVFIAIPFSPEFEKVFQTAVSPAIVSCGLVPYKTNDLNITSDIVQDIEDGIRRSLIVFADLTTSNANVYYEVGFARALGKKIITATQGEVSFDLRQKRYIHYTNDLKGLRKLRSELSKWIKVLIDNPIEHNLVPKALIHGTKFDVPNRNEFWNDLLRGAKGKFILLGGSNKSWIDKSPSQSRDLANSIVSIIKNGGNVIIMSDDRSEVISNHKTFFSIFIRPQLKSKSISLFKFKKRFIYATVNHTNYQAVISDSRIILLPKMNSIQFKDESLVIELEGSHLVQFKNYAADIERLFKEKQCTHIDITKK
jgi:hypothetical protein